MVPTSTIPRLLAAIGILVSLHGVSCAQTIHDLVLAGDIAGVERALKVDPRGIEARDNAGMTPLEVAARNGHRDLVGFLLRHGAKVDRERGYPWTPLYQAVSAGEYEIAGMLLRAGANPNTASTDELAAPLELAAQAGDERMLKLLLAHRARVDIGERGEGTPLMVAAREGHVGIVKLLLARGANIEAMDVAGRRPLDYAAWGGHADVVRLLLDRGASARARTGKGAFDRLARAVAGMNIEILQLFIDRGVPVVLVDPGSGASLLTVAAEAGPDRYDPDVGNYLFQLGAGPNGRDAIWRSSVLQRAITHRNRALIEQLLTHGAYLDLGAADGATPLHEAARVADTAIIRLLLEHGSNVDARDGAGITPLMAAAAHADTSATRLLLDRGAAPGLRARHGQTAMSESVLWMNSDVVGLLAGRGLLDPEWHDDNDETLLHLAARRVGGRPGDSAVVHMLIEAGVPLNRPDGRGYTPLMTAADNGAVEVVDALLQRGISDSTRARDGSTPLALAAWRGYDTLVARFLAAGADANARDNNGATALHDAVTARSSASVRYLLEAGADPTAVDTAGVTPLQLAERASARIGGTSSSLTEIIDMLRDALERKNRKARK